MLFLFKLSLSIKKLEIWQKIKQNQRKLIKLSGKKLKISEGGRKPNKGKKDKYTKKRSRADRERV